MFKVLEEPLGHSPLSREEVEAFHSGLLSKAQTQYTGAPAEHVPIETGPKPAWPIDHFILRIDLVFSAY